MRISTKIVLDFETGRVLERQSYEYRGAIDLTCGATQAQKDAQAAQAKLADEMTKDFATVFGENQAILSSLTAAMEPIIKAGPNQEGFAPAELSALRAQATDLNARGAQNAEVAASAKAATADGGNTAIPSGAQDQINAMVNESAAENLSQEQLGITASDYATGRQNFFTAEGALAGSAGALENPGTSAGNAAVGADTASLSAATQIQQANDEWVSAIGGLVGGLGGAALGNPSLKL